MRKPRIPMSPTQLPQQRVTTVIRMPDRPTEFHSCPAFDSEQHCELQQQCIPDSADYLCSLEWAWGPTNDLLVGYYLSDDNERNLWLLWTHAYNEDSLDWVSLLQRFAPRLDLSERDAAILLLHDCLLSERRRSGLEKYHWVAKEGLLNSSEVECVAREIWGSSDGDNSFHGLTNEQWEDGLKNW